MSRKSRDTNLFVYLLENKGELTEKVVSPPKRMFERNDELLTSALTLGEILVKPKEAGNTTLVRRYEQAIAASATVVPFDPAAASVLAAVRRERAVPPPDAIQPACASVAGVDPFITNGRRLSRRVVPGIHFVQSLAARRDVTVEALHRALNDNRFRGRTVSPR